MLVPLCFIDTGASEHELSTADPDLVIPAIHAHRYVRLSQRQIDKALGIHNSVVYRESLQNANDSGYHPARAKPCNDHRRRNAGKRTKRLPSMIAVVAGRLRKERSTRFIAPLPGMSTSHR